jgi:phosphoribosylformimino-5-aminoimidazole carboxamide ribotide isomerase
MPELIPVLDVRGGQTVHAIGGDRACYRPLRSVFAAGSDPITLGAALRQEAGLRTFYVADLDAIAGRPPQLDVLRGLSRLGVRLLVDAGIRDAGQIPPLRIAGVSDVVVALETLARPEALTAAIATADPGRVHFSLDLRAGRPLIPPQALGRWGRGTPDAVAVARRAVEAGACSIVLIDLARVGADDGLTGWVGPLLARLRGTGPATQWIVGGGLRGPEELPALDALGVRAVLAGSSLHAGRFTRAELARWSGSSRD